LKAGARLPKEILSRPLFSFATYSVLKPPLELVSTARRSSPTPTDLQNDEKLNESGNEEVSANDVPKGWATDNNRGGGPSPPDILAGDVDLRFVELQA
jgi:hypothetical protein